MSPDLSLQAWLQDPPWAPLPQDCGHTDTCKGCVQQMWAWEAARNPTGSEPGALSLVGGLPWSPLALRHTSA